MNYVSNIQLGAIAYFTGDFVPWKWMPCDGRSLSSTSYNVLHLVIGGKYGEDNLSFKVPTVAPLTVNGETLSAIFIAEGLLPSTIPDELCFITPEPSDGEPYLGLVVPYEGDELPMDWAWCDGSIIKILDFTALFSILGVRFGGDGINHFALPKIPGHIICIKGAYPMRP